MSRDASGYVALRLGIAVALADVKGAPAAKAMAM
jgi:hypothetical protein